LPRLGGVTGAFTELRHDPQAAARTDDGVGRRESAVGLPDRDLEAA
jgi:hypothetical protein